MRAKLDITLTVNGRERHAEVEPRMLLADVLRHEFGLKGTHIGCEHGVCGACTVMLDGRSARSCLHFAVAVDGAEIITVEGLSDGAALNPIQKAFHRNHALQCGYCTPGLLITIQEFLAAEPDPDDAAIRRALTNNICRCTGYANIVVAVRDAARALRAEAGS